MGLCNSSRRWVVTDGVKGTHVLRRKFGEANTTCEAGVDDGFHRACLLFDRHGGVAPMHIVQINACNAYEGDK